MDAHRLSPATVRRVGASFPAVFLLPLFRLLIHGTSLAARVFLRFFVMAMLWQNLIIPMHGRIDLHLPIQTRWFSACAISRRVSRFPPPTPSLPSGVIELTATRPASSSSFLPHPVSPSSLYTAHPCAERVPVVQTPSCSAEWVGSVAGVAGPEPWQWRVWGRSDVGFWW